MPGNDLDGNTDHGNPRRISVPNVPDDIAEGTSAWKHEMQLVIWRTRVTDWMEDKDEQDQRRFDTLVKLSEKSSEGTLDKLLRADTKTLTILVVAAVAVVAIIWGASVGYGDWSVNAKTPPASADGASMLEELDAP